MWALPREVGEGRDEGAPRPSQTRRGRVSPALGPSPAPPPTHQSALTSSSSQSLRAWYWNRGRPPAPPPRSRGAAAGAWAPRGLGPVPSSSGPWPPRRWLASGGAGKDREVLILPVNLWYSEAIGLCAPWLAVFGVFLSRLSPSRAPAPHPLQGEKGKKKEKKGRRQRGRSSRAPLSSRRWATAWLSLLRSLPRRLGEAGVWGCVLFSVFFFFNSLPRPRTA